MNDFPTDLQYSLESNDDEYINSRYFVAFPHLVKVETNTDIELQYKGIDKILHFSNGHSYYVDEKKRRKDYGDILIEEYSNFETKRIGWISKEHYTDYISYIVYPTKIMYILPFLILQRVWLQNYNEWQLQYGRKFAQNDGYTTSNIAIPKDILFKELVESMKLSL
jgi:hypothetical protein